MLQQTISKDKKIVFKGYSSDMSGLVNLRPIKVDESIIAAMATAPLKTTRTTVFTALTEKRTKIGYPAYFGQLRAHRGCHKKNQHLVF